jgi:hypothetical protein
MVSDKARGYAHDGSSGLDIFTDDCPSSDHRPRPNDDTGEDDGSGSDGGVLVDKDPLG